MPEVLAGAAQTLAGDPCSTSPVLWFSFYAFGPSSSVRLERLPAMATRTRQTTVRAGGRSVYQKIQNIRVDLSQSYIYAFAFLVARYARSSKCDLLVKLSPRSWPAPRRRSRGLVAR